MITLLFTVFIVVVTVAYAVASARLFLPKSRTSAPEIEPSVPSAPSATPVHNSAPIPPATKGPSPMLPSSPAGPSGTYCGKWNGPAWTSATYKYAFPQTASTSGSMVMTVGGTKKFPPCKVDYSYDAKTKAVSLTPNACSEKMKSGDYKSMSLSFDKEDDVISLKVLGVPWPVNSIQSTLKKC